VPQEHHYAPQDAPVRQKRISFPNFMQIRLATDSDESALSRIYLDCRSNTFYWTSENEFALHDFKRDTEGEVVLVAVENETILGFASIWAKDNFLHHLFVDSKYQGRRIGKSLIDHCLEGLLKRPARLKCVIRNERACRFYAQHGWEIESTTEDGPMGPYHTYVLS
jgi:GNAT superfamily N-acetyltransferase